MGVDRSEDVASATARNPVVVTVRGGLDHDTLIHSCSDSIVPASAHSYCSTHPSHYRCAYYYPTMSIVPPHIYGKLLFSLFLLFPRTQGLVFYTHT